MIDTSTGIDWSARDHMIWYRSRYHSVAVLAVSYGLTENEVRTILDAQLRKIGAA